MYICDTISGGEDYVLTSVTLTFNGTSTKACTDIPITPDDDYEENETFFVSLTTPDNNVTLNPDRGAVTIIDDDGMTKYPNLKIKSSTGCFFLSPSEVTIGFERTLYMVGEDNGYIEVCASLRAGSLQASAVVTVVSVDGIATGEFVWPRIGNM